MALPIKQPQAYSTGPTTVSPGYSNLQANAQSNLRSMFPTNNGNPNGVYNRDPGYKGPEAFKPGLASPAPPQRHPTGAQQPTQAEMPASFNMDTFMQMLMGLMGGQNGNVGAAPVNYGGQHPSLGRYVPPMMEGRGSTANPTSWLNSGGYAYNAPNSYGVGTGTGLGTFMYPPIWG